MRLRTGSVVVKNGRIYARVGWTENGKRRTKWRAAQTEEHAREICAGLLKTLPAAGVSAGFASGLMSPFMAASSTGTLSVYFIQMDDGAIRPIKIGLAMYPENRFNALAVGSPYPLKMLLSCLAPGGIYTETALHKKFSNLRMRGEWFRGEASLIDYVNRLVEADTETRERVLLELTPLTFVKRQRWAHVQD